MAHAHDIRLKKKFGQHFLRDPQVTAHIIEAVTITPRDSIFEIGCGDGFLTRTILTTPCARLWAFEIDPEWATHVKTQIKDSRLRVIQQDFLTIDFTIFDPFKPWVLLANLPYQITFPILYRLQQHREYLKEGVIMIQEEVAQKIVKKHGRDYGFASLFFQHFFEWRLLDKIPPTAFHPAPKIFSRLLYFKPKTKLTVIEQEAEFWEFIKQCFSQPRRTLKNNLSRYEYSLVGIPEELLLLRAQQMDMQQLLELWAIIRKNRIGYY